MKPTALTVPVIPALAIGLALTAAPLQSLAHKAWLLPSQTIVAGQDPVITVDAAVSNDLFYFNHVPLRLDNLTITAPDGTQVKPANPATGKYRNVFDVTLSQQGTYRLSILNDGVTARWKDNGQDKRWRGKAAEVAGQVPANAQDLQVHQWLNRVDTFVTHGTPNQTALKPSGTGLELIAVTHPNDLFANEQAKFKLQVNGKPAANVEVEIVRGGTRYRNAQEDIKVSTDANGEFSVTWPAAGMYWLEATTHDNATTVSGAKQRNLGYVATMEVLPN